MRATIREWLEALGAVLIVVGLVFWSLPAALICAGAFLIVAAAAPPGPHDSRPAPAPRRAGTRAS